jgi:hypothetical protein
MVANAFIFTIHILTRIQYIPEKTEELPLVGISPDTFTISCLASSVGNRIFHLIPSSGSKVSPIRSADPVFFRGEQQIKDTFL